MLENWEEMNLTIKIRRARLQYREAIAPFTFAGRKGKILRGSASVERATRAGG